MLDSKKFKTSVKLLITDLEQGRFNNVAIVYVVSRLNKHTKDNNKYRTSTKSMLKNILTLQSFVINNKYPKQIINKFKQIL